MQGVELSANRPGGARAPAASSPAAAAAGLLRWWQLAGVDTLVAARPAPWLVDLPDEDLPGADLPDAELPAAAPSAPADHRRAAVAAVPIAQDWSRFATLAQLQAHLRAASPALPFADGNPDSGLMLVGDGPSAEDLRSGRPFSGPAGQMLDRMLAAIGLDRRTAYVALLCPRAPVARPTPDMIAADLALTCAHIRLARPRCLVLLGASPVRALTGEGAAISRVRGNWLKVQAGDAVIEALATFNPAFLLRRPAEKARAWADLLALKRRLGA